MKSKTKKRNAPLPIGSGDLLGDDLLIKLLEIELKQSRMHDKLRDLVGGECDNLYAEGIVDVVLDALGVPVDNTVETNACDVANATGVWPDWAYCRDSYHEKWYEQTQSINPSPKKYIAWVRRVNKWTNSIVSLVFEVYHFSLVSVLARFFWRVECYLALLGGNYESSKYLIRSAGGF